MGSPTSSAGEMVATSSSGLMPNMDAMLAVHAKMQQTQHAMATGTSDHMTMSSLNDSFRSNHSDYARSDTSSENLSKDIDMSDVYSPWNF